MLKFNFIKYYIKLKVSYSLRVLILSAIFSLCSDLSIAQTLYPVKIDDQCFKTTGTDYFNSAKVLKNKNYIISAYFGNKNFIPNQPDTFCHLILVDSNFNILKAVKSPMFAHKIFENHDGSLTIIGTIIKLFDSQNVFDDIHGTDLYQPDIALMKINSNLDSIILTKSIGGTGEEAYLSGIVRTNDNGIIFSAATRSYNGDIPNNRPCLNTFNYDAFLCKTDSNFNIEWLKVFEGENGELAMGELIEIKDDVFRIDIRSSSNQCEFSNTKPFTGVFKSLIVLFDAQGNVLKKKIYDDENDLEWKIGGWHKNDTTVILGYASSKNTYFPTYPKKDKTDFAIALYDTSFNIIGMKLWGGLGYDFLIDYLIHDDYIYVFGMTNSSDTASDIKGYHGGECDYYIAKLDFNFNIIWNRAVGSTGMDCRLGSLPFPLRKLFINKRNELIILFEIFGPDSIPDGDVNCSIKDTSNTSGIQDQDAWIIKFDLNSIPSYNQNIELETKRILIYPNPSDDIIVIETNGINLINSNIKIFDLNGKLILEEFIKTNQSNVILNLNRLKNSNQLLFIKIFKENYTLYSGKILIN